MVKIFLQAGNLLSESPPLKQHPGVRVKVSAGKGVFAKVPWIAFLHEKVTATTRRGVYLVFLFRADMSGVYMTLNQGVTEPKRELGPSKGLEELRRRAEKLRAKYGDAVRGRFDLDDNIDLRIEEGLGSDYEASTVAHKLYAADALPTDEAILDDLSALLTVYENYVSEQELTQGELANAGGNPVASWVFQANPEMWDLRAALKELTTFHWLVRQHASEIHPGDRVYLWESGSDGGVLGIASVASGPADVEDGADERKFNRREEKFDGLQPRVLLHIEKVLASPLPRSTLKDHPILGEVAILKNPRGTNFALTREQAEALRALTDGGVELVSPAETFDRGRALAQLTRAIEERGFIFEPWQVAAYVTALRTKPFVILAGVSGTGKTRLPRLVSELTGGAEQLLPVRPDWTDSSDVLGYLDLQGRFRPGAVLQFAKKAAESPSVQHVCIIDEMNLARVEQYFAEILSRVEDRIPRPDGSWVTGPLIAQPLPDEFSAWASLGMTSNLAIVGTVNMDETTHGFSRKVLDRAFTIEMSDVDLAQWQPVAGSNKAGPWPVESWRPRAAQLAQLQPSKHERQIVEESIAVLIELNEMLAKAQLQVGYRVRDEIALFRIHSLDVGSGNSCR